ncbi:MAG: sugar transporter [Comamonadaceae bacterium PBBC1]|nr:MAG: sugar transporter [Comamonadaceae bacterium PBBC1]
MSSLLKITSSVWSAQTQGWVWRGLVLTALCLAGGALHAQDSMGVMPTANGSLGSSGVGGAAPLNVQAPGGLPSPLPSMRSPLGAAVSGGANPLGAYGDMGQGTGPVVQGASAERPALGTNQFQRFVQNATGRDLSLHGYNLFNGQKYSALANLPVPAGYVLGPGDDIDLKLWGSVDMAQRLTVDRNGQINIPKVGTVTVAGTRADQLEKTLKSHIGRVFNNFELNATLGRLRSIQVYVVGQARQPGAYTVPGMSSLLSTLFESGGPSATGSMRHIQLVRAGKTVTTLDLYAFIHSGRTEGDAQLLPGDVIVIPPAGPRVAVLGALDAPAIYELRQAQETLAQLLQYSGGIKVITTPHKALVERIDTANKQAPRSVQERSLDVQGLQSTVRDGDVLTLFPVGPQFSNAVTLRGNVAAPLRYSFQAGMRIADLIPEPQALIQGDYYTRKNIIVQYETGKNVSSDRVINDVKNLLEEINWDYAAIERLDAQQVKTRLIPFNLKKAIQDKDPAHNLPLQVGDVVTVFGVKDLPVPIEQRTQFVRIGGEVKVPGIYEVKPGETLMQLLDRVGGFSRNAYAYGTVFTRESTRREQQANLDKAIRKMEQDINNQAATQLQNAIDADKSAAAQSQIAGQRLLLKRLEGLQASGRIALEMSAADTQLPHIVLEDGDSITVPHKPSFVGVVGAVQAETSFIHKVGYTVGEYIEKAGPSATANLDAALLIRADGTVQANKAQRSWTGRGNSQFMSTLMQPGDTIFVPEELDRRSAYTQFIQGAKDWTAILYQFGIGAAALKTLK